MGSRCSAAFAFGLIMTLLIVGPYLIADEVYFRVVSKDHRSENRRIWFRIILGMLGASAAASARERDRLPILIDANFYLRRRNFYDQHAASTERALAGGRLLSS